VRGQLRGCRLASTDGRIPSPERAIRHDVLNGLRNGCPQEPHMSERREVPDFHCPGCGQHAAMVIGTEQATCGNAADCPIIFFNPSLRYSPDDLANAHKVDLGPHEAEAEG
jgi:hypothetical protein